MQALVPPQMIEIDAVGAIAILQLKRSIAPMSCGVGAGAALCASIIEASSTWRADVLEDLAGSTTWPSRSRRRCRAPAGTSGSPSRRGRPAFALGASTWRAPSRRGRGRCSPDSTLSRKRMTSSMNSLSPFHSSQVSRLSETGSTPRCDRCRDGRVPVGSVISRAQVRGRDLEPEVAVMLGHRPVHRVDEDDVGLAGREAGLDQLLEQGARIDRGAHATRPWGCAA